VRIYDDPPPALRRYGLTYWMVKLFGKRVPGGIVVEWGTDHSMRATAYRGYLWRGKLWWL